MSKRRLLVFLVFLMLFTGCESDSINKEVNKVFNFTGVWSIGSVENLDYRSENGKSDFNHLIGQEIKIGSDRIMILDNDRRDIKYKLKSVGADYTLFYENGLTMSSFMNGRETIDLISVIDRKQIIAEFFLNSDNEMVLIYKSCLIRLSRISKEVIFNNEDDNINVDNKFENDKKDFTEGVMLGIKTPREKKDDGSYSEEKYKTLWISHNNWNIANIYEKDNILFPRLNGIWRLSAKKIISNGFSYDEFKVNMYDEILKEEINIEMELKQNEFKSIKFIGNDYIAIEKYEGTDFKGNYPIYQIVPVNNINIENGLQIDEIFNNNEKEKYLNQYRNEINNLPKEKLKDLNINNIDYNNISIERRTGRWMYVANILPNDMSESGANLKIPILPDNRFINYNSLYISWKTLKGQLGLFKDVFISPLNKIAIIQFNNYISIYKIENDVLIEEPLVTIDIEENEEVIMAEWASGSYVKQWEKVFLDGRVIIKNK